MTARARRGSGDGARVAHVGGTPSPDVHRQRRASNRLPADERGLTIADFLVPIRLGERMGIRLRHVALIVLGRRPHRRRPADLVPAFRARRSRSPARRSASSLVGGALGFRRGLAEHRCCMS